ncbi:FAAR117Cp [Eremothecium gossypii FDAG1]|nr:FAAR117Cp [Eremothecium gossypii FDAG1]
MGKGIAKFGFKSGILPKPRPILKHPTVNMTAKVQEALAPKPKGPSGVGYADNIAHPAGSRREPEPVKFIDVEQMIKATVPEPQQARQPASEQQAAKNRIAAMRREYLSDAFRAEERRLLRQEELLRQRQQLLEEESQRQLAEATRERASDLTIPTLEELVNEPLMRQRTPEEQKLVDMKRKHNREVLALRIQERRMAQLVSLYHAAEEYIVTEPQLLRHIDEVFSSENAHTLKNRPLVSASGRENENERAVLDTLFGTVAAGRFDGLPAVRDFLAGEQRAAASAPAPDSASQPPVN